MDWGAFVAVGLAVAGGLVGYGVLRQKVANLASYVADQDAKIDRLAVALEKATSVGQQVALLQQSTESGHTLLRTEQHAANNLLNEKLDRVAGEVRSFMQGQASGGQSRRAVKAG